MAMNWFKKYWKTLTEQMPRKEAITTSPARIELPPEAERNFGNNFTPRAQQVVQFAREEARRLNHNFVGTEHLLLGLLKLGCGVAVNVLGKQGLDLESVRNEVEKQMPIGPEPIVFGNIPYTPRVKKVIALAQKDAKQLNHTYVGTEHILLGLLREGDGLAARVLQKFGVDLEETRREILRELDPTFLSEPDDQANNVTSKDTTSMSPNSELPKNPEPGQPKQELIDTSKHYDVYCTERNQETVVYRNALFKGIKRLHQSHQYDFMSQFIELEQVDGQTIFVARNSVVKFCEPNVGPNVEAISTKKPAG